ncbi:TetR/AcrR family transcriptional regulator [Micromonospora tarensis]|uniref:TetR family transcriptional regulator n=1 Tax=Micromonospora tarensis TaxID=2806100 RepID=A0ABS1YFC3_9ACTN|nr:TetR/AcrR family transcriptional regulator [Micromonospora tarensis]MBM0275911.1 TetR family transcriptional regulator [Micromonospora tarensis]
MQITPGVDRKTRILEAVVELLAERGYPGATFARIVETAGLSSTRLITYHYDTKQELVAAALRHIGARAQQFMVPAIEAESSARGKLAAYLRSNLRFLAERPAYARAAVEIARNLPRESTGADLGEDVPVVLLAQLFVAGQEAGELRRFDPVVMAVTVRAAVDAAVDRFARDDGMDLAAYAEELCAIFDRAIAVRPASGDPGTALR